MAWALALATWFLIIVGGYVRVTGSGMGCSGWPDCDGRWIRVADMKAAIEMAHRYAAAAVSALAGVALVAAYRQRRTLPQVLLPAAAAVVLIVIQIGLGAWTVFTGNRGDTVVMHLMTALLLLGAATWAAVASGTGGAGGTAQRPGSQASSTTTMYAAIALGVLVLAGLGGVVQVTGGGFLCPDFPLCGGRAWPVERGTPALVHMLHRGVALATIVPLVLATRGALASGDARLRRYGIAAAGLFTLQAVVGVAQVATGMHPALRLAHLAIGAAVWAACVAALARAAGMRAASVAATAGRRAAAPTDTIRSGRIAHG